MARAGPILLSPHETYLALGAMPRDRQAAYRSMFARGLDEAMVATLRDATQRGWVAGSDGCWQRMAAALGRRADPPRRGRPPKEASVDDAPRVQPRLL